jgi:hypothetical protein
MSLNFINTDKACFLRLGLTGGLSDKALRDFRNFLAFFNSVSLLPIRSLVSMEEYQLPDYICTNTICKNIVLVEIGGLRTLPSRSNWGAFQTGKQ